MNNGKENTGWFKVKTKAELSTIATLLLKQHGIQMPCRLSVIPLKQLNIIRAREMAKQQREQIPKTVIQEYSSWVTMSV